MRCKRQMVWVSDTEITFKQDRCPCRYQCDCWSDSIDMSKIVLELSDGWADKMHTPESFNQSLVECAKRYSNISIRDNRVVIKPYSSYLKGGYYEITFRTDNGGWNTCYIPIEVVQEEINFNKIPNIVYIGPSFHGGY